MKIINPYDTTTPAVGSKFFGRQKLLDDAIYDLNQRKSLVFYGQRRIGKTSFLKEVERQLREGEQFVVYMDLNVYAKHPIRSFLNDLCKAIKDEIKIDLTIPVELDPLGGSFRKEFLPQVYEAIHNKRLILLFDEFDSLSPNDQRLSPDDTSIRLFSLIHGWVSDDVERKLSLVFVVGRNVEQLDKNFLQTLKECIPRLFPVVLSFEETLNLIKQPSKDHLVFSEEALSKIYDSTNGHPYLVQLFCYLIFDSLDKDISESSLINTKSDVSGEFIDKITPEALEKGLIGLSWLVEAVPNDVHMIALSGIAHLAINNQGVSEEGLKELIGSTRLRGDPAVLEAPKNLVLWQYLEVKNNHYYFKIPILSDWLRGKYPFIRTLSSLADTVDVEAQQYFEKGLQEYDRNNKQQALEDFETAVRLNRKHIKALSELGRLHLEHGNIDAAIENYQRAFDLEKGKHIASRLMQSLLTRIIRRQEQEDSRAFTDLRLLLSTLQYQADITTEVYELLQSSLEKYFEEEEWSYALEIVQALQSIDSINATLWEKKKNDIERSKKKNALLLEATENFNSKRWLDTIKNCITALEIDSDFILATERLAFAASKLKEEKRKKGPIREPRPLFPFDNKWREKTCQELEINFDKVYLNDTFGVALALMSRNNATHVAITKGSETSDSNEIITILSREQIVRLLKPRPLVVNQRINSLEAQEEIILKPNFFECAADIKVTHAISMFTEPRNDPVSKELSYPSIFVIKDKSSKVLGLLSPTDIIRAMHAEVIPVPNISTQDCMIKKEHLPAILNSDDSPSKFYFLAEQAELAIPYENEQGNFVGLITRDDFFRHWLDFAGGDQPPLYTLVQKSISSIRPQSKIKDILEKFLVYPPPPALAVVGGSKGSSLLGILSYVNIFKLFNS